MLNACPSVALGARAVVSVRNPVRLGDRTEPQPDLAVLKLDRRRGVPLAADALLVIEVADSSLAYDRGFTKVRYRGIAKNLGRAHVAFGLSNLYRLRGALGGG